MTTTDLQPGDIVQHPEHGAGIVLKNFPGVPTIYFAGERGYENTTRRFTDWERVEIVRPGHVQVRVEDFDLTGWESEDEAADEWGMVYRLTIRIAKALAAQRAASMPPADDALAARFTPGPNAEKPPVDEPSRDAMVTLPCPDCGEQITDTASLGIEDEGGYYLTFANSETHTCSPAQPDEPQEFGAKVTVNGVRWMRVNGYVYSWRNQNGGATTWDDLVKRGRVTLGWDDDVVPMCDDCPQQP